MSEHALKGENNARKLFVAFKVDFFAVSASGEI